MRLWLLLHLAVLTGYAVPGTYEEAMRVRGLIGRPIGVSEKAAEKYLLPVSRGFSQKGTELCWAYSTLSGLESNYLAKFPDRKLELSRRAMQIFTMEDRYRRYINGTEKFLSERGIALDALSLIRQNGLVAFDDYGDIVDPYGEFNFVVKIAAALTLEGKLQTLLTGLNQKYGYPPLATHLESKQVSRGELTNAVLMNQIWQSFALQNGPTGGLGKHPDPDARAEAVSWFIPREEFAAKIKESLKADHSVEVTIGGHSILLYGAEYNEQGEPIVYYMKDSYPDYFYKSFPEKLHNSLLEISTAVN